MSETIARIELKHLATYLPYGLTGIDRDEGDVITFLGYRPKAENNSEYYIGLSEDYEGWWKSDEFKPILRPLSDLTKEIELNGERVCVDTLINQKLASLGRAGGAWNAFEIIRTLGDEKGYDHIPHAIYQDLIKWHFDVFGLIDKGLAIDMNTIKQGA